MSSLYGILSSGSRSIASQQTGISVTGQNIANVNTPGYTRRRVSMETGGAGAGVNTEHVQRVYDRYIESRISTENQVLGQWKALNNVLQEVEVVLTGSSGDGLDTFMGQFWNAWQDLVNSPEGFTERITLLASSRNMTDAFNRTSDALSRVQDDTERSITGCVQQINSMAREIADLNQAVVEAGGSGQDAGELLDRRDARVKELAMLIGTDTFQDSRGGVTIMVGGGRPLVEGGMARQLSVNGDGKVLWNDGTGTSVDITSQIRGGQLNGWIEARDAIIPGYLESLDTLAQTLKDEVNALHRTGCGLPPDAGGVPPTGLDFFVGDSAADLTINSAIDTDMIAAASSADGVPGDGSNALALAGLRTGVSHPPVDVNGTARSIDGTTLNDFYNALVADVGTAVLAASFRFENQTAVVSSVESYRESVSGVNLDEEMVNLVKYQTAYEASARLIQTVDELLDTVINMVR